MESLIHTSVANNNLLSIRPTKQSTGWTFILVLTGVATIFGSSIPVGFNIGVVNTPSKIIKQWCNESVISRYGIALSEQHLDNLWSAIVSIFLIGGMIGSLVGACVADKVGRRGAMVVGGITALLAAVLFIISKPLNSVEVMLLGRLLAGLSGGLVTAVMPMYLTELAPVNLRGATGTFCPLGLCLGVLMGQIMGLPFILGREEAWNYLLGFYAMLILISGMALPWLPESPKYLYTVKGLRQKAIRELSRLRNLPGEFVCGELEEKEEVSANGWSVLKLICSKPLRIHLALVCALQAGQQFSGINAVFYYSVNIFKTAGLSDSNAQFASLGAGAINFLIALIMIPVINKFPRRSLAIGSCVTATTCLVLLSFSINYMNSFSWMPYLSIVAVLSYVLCYGVGLGPIPYFIGAELFDLGPRPFAMALGSVSNWSGNFIVGMTFLELQHLIGPYSFLIFATFTGLLAIFLKTCLPETNILVLVKEEIRIVSLTAEQIERI
ncbi:solute carrier family 2, facilitated glucose transporter member 1-like isoform X2 [Rhodnius prolixus]|uniref:solute carrier family 2, facilitated glucose transporter member 1-like isoform X2 n=1 Tax=Rhodnius prolixus TaxID=13249 RepID=UPI003D189266